MAKITVLFWQFIEEEADEVTGIKLNADKQHDRQKINYKNLAPMLRARPQPTDAPMKTGDVRDYEKNQNVECQLTMDRYYIQKELEEED